MGSLPYDIKTQWKAKNAASRGIGGILSQKITPDIFFSCMSRYHSSSVSMWSVEVSVGERWWPDPAHQDWDGAGRPLTWQRERDASQPNTNKNKQTTSTSTSYSDIYARGVRGSQIEVLLAPALLCHKVTAQGTQSPLLGAFLSFSCVFTLYGIKVPMNIEQTESTTVHNRKDTTAVSVL